MLAGPKISRPIAYSDVRRVRPTHAPEVREVYTDVRAFRPHRKTIGSLGPALDLAAWRGCYPRRAAGIAT